MKSVELSHEAAQLLEMYGHIIRKVAMARDETGREDLAKVYIVIKNHRQKMIYLLDKVFNHLVEKENNEQETS